MKKDKPERKGFVLVNYPIELLELNDGTQILMAHGVDRKDLNVLKKVLSKVGAVGVAVSGSKEKVGAR